MKQILFSLFLLITVITFGQKPIDSKRLKQAISAVKKGECVLLFNDNRFASDFEKKQLEELTFLQGLDAKTIDSLFFQEDDIKLRITLYFILCTKYRSQITEKHFDAMKSTQEIKLCSGRNAESAPLNELASYLYKNSVERKEKIKNPEALKLYTEAIEIEYNGPVDFELMISKLNQADSIEPNNPIILDARGDAKLNSKIDVDGAFEDFQKAITYSLDQDALEIRYHNRGIIYMRMQDITLACEDWHKAGEMAEEYINIQCHQQFDSIIHQNPDNSLEFNLNLTEDTVYITSLYNHTSDCRADIVIKNSNHPTLTIVGNYLDYGLESNKNSCYLEAVSESGQKFLFYNSSDFYSYEDEPNLFSLNEDPNVKKNDSFQLNKGTQFEQNIDVTGSYHFPRAGTYKVRLAIRDSENLQGLNGIYYSNWQKLVVVRDYRTERFDYMDEER